MKYLIPSDSCHLITFASMKFHLYLFGLLLPLFLLMGCGNDSVVEEITSVSNEIFAEIELDHARCFKIERSVSHIRITFFDPWNNYESCREVLIGVHDSTDQNVNHINNPRKIVALSSTQIGRLEQLGLTDLVVGISTKSYVYHPTILQRVENDIITEVSNGSLNKEVLLSIEPDIVIASGFSGANEEYDFIESAGIPVIQDLDWQESTVLGRLEWIKVYGALFNKLETADSLYRTYAAAYEEMAAMAQEIPSAPRILSGHQFKSVWHTPGGQSYMAELFKDAGGAYEWAADSSTGSIPLSLETVIDLQQNDSIWINVGTINSLSELEAADARYAGFSAFQNTLVYNNNKRQGKYGSNDYWESGLANPHLLLKDLIRILHPAIFPDHEPVYYVRLK